MDLAEIRTLTNYYLDHVAEDYFDRGYLNVWINEAYRNIVAILDQEHLPVGNLTVDLSVTSDAREYDVKAASTPRDFARHILDVCKVTDEGRESDLDRVEYAERNRADYFGWYTYEKLPGQWVLGFTDEQPPTMTVRVRYAGPVAKLTAESQVPIHVPDTHHGLIAIRAALLIKQSVNRELGQLPGIYAEQVRSMLDAHRARHRGRHARRWT